MDNIAPPSNLPGNTYHNELVTDRSAGWHYFDGVISRSEEVPVLVAESIKSQTLKGDKHKAMPYRRTITRLTENRPVVIRKRVSNSTNGALFEDITSSRHISNDRSIIGTYLPTRCEVLADNARAASTTKALGKVNSNKMQLAVDFIEARKTVSQLASIAGQTLKAVRAIKHGNLALALKHLYGDGWASHILGYNYGIKPLIDTVKTAFELAKESLEKDLIAYGKSTMRWSDEFEYSQGNLLCKVKAEGGHKVFLAGRVDKLWLAQATQFGLTNPASIAWELVPFSFVVDWFIPVGNMLEGLTSSLGMEYIDGYSTSFYGMSESASSTEKSFDFPGLSQVVSDPGLWQKEFRYVRRETPGAFPWPQLYAKDNPFSTTHVVNAVALLRGLLR